MLKRIIIIMVCLLVVCGLLFTDTADAAKKTGKKSGMSATEIQELTTAVDNYTRKIYSNSLFSPQETQNLVEIKIKLDNQMIIAPDPALAPIYFKIGMIFKAREYKEEAIDCFMTILENFADTAFSPKSRKMLESLGVDVTPADSISPLEVQ